MSKIRDSITCIVMWIAVVWLVVYAVFVTKSAWCLWALWIPGFTTICIASQRDNSEEVEENEYGRDNPKNEGR